MPDLFRYSNSFEPILLEGMTATLKGSEIAEEGLNVVCKAVIALPEYQKDFGALLAGQWTTDQEDANLELQDWEFGQFRMRVQDDIQVRLNNPSPTKLWRTKSQNFILPQFPTVISEDWLKQFLFKASEFFVFEDTTPRFDLYSVIALAKSRILFSGWKFKLARYTAKGKIDLWVNSWPPGS